MSGTVLLLIQQVIIMFLLALVGYLCFKAGKITMAGSRDIGNILIYLSLPCVIVNSFLVEYSRERAIGLLYSSLAAILAAAVSVIISRLFFSKDAVLCFASSFSNPGFFGIPIIAATINSGAVFYVAFFVALANLLMWSYGVALLTAKNGNVKEKGAWKQYIPTPKRFFTAPFMIACLVGLFFFFTGLEVPHILRQGVQYISNMNTPLAMFAIGIYLAQTDLLAMLRKTKLYALSAVRLLIIPLVSIAILLVIPQQYEEIRMALLIVSACPAGSNVAVYAQLYHNDYAYAVETVVISTLLSIVTIPLIVQLAGFVW